MIVGGGGRRLQVDALELFTGVDFVVVHVVGGAVEGVVVGCVIVSERKKFDSGVPSTEYDLRKGNGWMRKVVRDSLDESGGTALFLPSFDDGMCTSFLPCD